MALSPAAANERSPSQADTPGKGLPRRPERTRYSPRKVMPQDIIARVFLDNYSKVNFPYLRPILPFQRRVAMRKGIVQTGPRSPAQCGCGRVTCVNHNYGRS